jgi:hypothetical protein
LPRERTMLGTQKRKKTPSVLFICTCWHKKKVLKYQCPRICPVQSHYPMYM